MIILRINNETSKSSSNFLWCQYICKEGILHFPPDTHQISSLDAKFGWCLKGLEHREQWISRGYLPEKQKQKNPLADGNPVNSLRNAAFLFYKSLRDEKGGAEARSLHGFVTLTQQEASMRVS